MKKTLQRWFLAPLLGVLALGSAASASPDPAPGGRYALQLRVASVARTPMIGTTHSVATSVMLVDLRRQDGGWMQSHRVCEARVDSGSPLARLVIPREFVDALPVRDYRATLGPDVGSRYTADMGTEAIGFDPARTGGTLPREADAPGVEDPDGDGEPGATLRLRVPGLGSARLFIVQRSHLVLNGRRVEPGRIEGSIDVRLQEQHTLGADPGIFRQNPSISADPQRSGFTLIRVAPGTGCDDLSRGAAALFR